MCYFVSMADKLSRRMEKANYVFKLDKIEDLSSAFDPIAALAL